MIAVGHPFEISITVGNRFDWEFTYMHYYEGFIFLPNYFDIRNDGRQCILFDFVDPDLW